MANQHTIAQVFRHSIKYSFLLLFLLCSSAAIAQSLSTENKKAAKLYEEGRKLYQQNRLEAAAIELHKALERDESFYEANTILAYVYLDMMQYDKAKEQFRAAIIQMQQQFPTICFFLQN